jgi:hypothetical protein
MREDSSPQTMSFFYEYLKRLRNFVLECCSNGNTLQEQWVRYHFLKDQTEIDSIFDALLLQLSSANQRRSFEWLSWSFALLISMMEQVEIVSHQRVRDMSSISTSMDFARYGLPAFTRQIHVVFHGNHYSVLRPRENS